VTPDDDGDATLHRSKRKDPRTNFSADPLLNLIHRVIVRRRAGAARTKGKSMKTVFAAVVLAGSLAGFGAANAAMPLAPLTPSASADVIPVAGGCGMGFHRGPMGGCRPNGGVVVVERPPVIVVRPCPPGFFRGPRGACRR
jgi:hypothetical protein